MKKGTLQLFAFGLVFVISMIIKPMPAIGYGGLPVSASGEDFFDLLLVMIILTGIESVSGKIIGIVIDPIIKNVIGMCMMLMVGAIILQFGWVSPDYFESSVVAQVPITLIDVYILATTGAVLFWAGGLAYRITIDVTNSVGNICWWFLKKVGLGDPEVEGAIKEVG